jgi:hypothetical protein
MLVQYVKFRGNIDTVIFEISAIEELVSGIFLIDLISKFFFQLRNIYGFPWFKNGFTIIR